MTSPLLPYVNARLLVQAPGAVSETNGRMVQGASASYLVKCFLKRADSTGTESGARKVPATRGSSMPGVSGQLNLYRGYGLQYATLSGAFTLGASSESGLIWTDITSRPEWIFPGLTATLKVGVDQVVFARIEQASGVFGGLGIDELVYQEVGGVPLIISGGMLQG